MVNALNSPQFVSRNLLKNLKYQETFFLYGFIQPIGLAEKISQTQYVNRNKKKKKEYRELNIIIVVNTMIIL